MTDLKTITKWRGSFQLTGFWLLIVAGMLALALNSCSSTDSEESIDNRFSLEITPSGENSTGKAVKETVQGFSFFATGQDPEFNQQAFGIYLNNNEDIGTSSTQEGFFGILARNSGQPDTGNYNLNDFRNDGSGFESGSTFAFVLFRNSGSAEETSTVFAESGTLTLTTSNSDVVKGSITATGIEIGFSANEFVETPVTITGEFTATNVEFFLGSGILPN